MSKKLPTDGFKWKKNVLKFHEDFVKNYGEDGDEGYIFKVDIEYPKNLHGLHIDLPFLPEKMKINKYSKLVCNLYDVFLILKKVHRVIQFNQEAWLKEYIHMNTE